MQLKTFLKPSVIYYCILTCSEIIKETILRHWVMHQNTQVMVKINPFSIVFTAEAKYNVYERKNNTKINNLLITPID